MQRRVATARMNAVALMVVGALGVSGTAILLKLPQRIRRGERGQQAIAMLDAVRRPFLDIKQAQALLLNPVDAQAGNAALSRATASATGLLERYEELARYNGALASNVGELSEAFETWVAAEHRLFRSPETSSGGTAIGPPTGGFLSDLASATSGFSNTMAVLGAGEVPIHADIVDGRMATRLLGMLALMLLLCFTAAVFWLQHATSKRELRFLEERVRLAQEARELERVLGEALTKVLGGYIPICASCKRVRSESNQWTQVESYVSQRTEAHFSHGICPECEKRLYGDAPSETPRPTLR